MIDVQISAELSYALALTHVLFNVALLIAIAATAGRRIAEGERHSAARWVLWAVVFSLLTSPCLWALTRWYARLAELRGW